MQVTTIQGIIKNGQILLSEDISLPEMTEVYVIIPPNKNAKKIMSPRLVNKSDAAKFVKTVQEDTHDEV
jgi:hypothetical protein